MPAMEVITIVNKSGVVVSTGKHLVNIFKDAKEAYNDKKAELKADHHFRLKHRSEQKLIEAREETRSTTSSRHSHRSRSHRHRERDPANSSRPPLTEHNLSYISEGSVASSRRSRSSHHGSRSPRSPREYQPPQVSTELSHPALQRRHTDFPSGAPSAAPSTLPPPYTSQLSRLPRAHSNPDFHGESDIDMNLAYGKLPPDLQVSTFQNETLKQQELQATMTKLDALLLEAHCLQHSATAIISNLQANPEAMAAVALTLAELSNILTKMSPGILTALKSSSPAIFALLASPQFLIAGGVALGVTVVMFGGYKIIKKIQANNEERKEANRMEEAMVYEGTEVGSVETWRRGIVGVDVQAESVDGEFITPEAARQKKERARERKREERAGKSTRAESVVSESKSERTIRRAGSESTLRQRAIPVRSSSGTVVAPSESGRSSRSKREKEGKGKELVVSEKKEKKKSPLSVMFRKAKDRGKEGRESSVSSHRPRLVEV